MRQGHDRQKLLLSIPSPLYAPLYLAKVAGLDPVFQQLDFEYRASRKRLRRGDHLVRDVLSLTTDLDCLAAVCDPYRALIKDAMGEGMMDRPLIVGCLVQHMCYWLVDGHDRDSVYSEKGITHEFDHIIVAQRHTTNYAVAADHLLNKCDVPDIKAADSFLYSYPASGSEQLYYRWFHKKTCKLAYMTMNPLSLYEFGREGAVKKPFLQDERYRNTFMTGVVVGSDAYRSKPAEIDGLMNGIVKAIDHIYRDPLLAARQLQSYRDDYISFTAEDMPFDHLVAALEHLVDKAAYPVGGKISDLAMERGAEVRSCARPVNPDAPHLMELGKIKECVKKEIVQPSAAKPGPVMHEPWVHRFMVNALCADTSSGEQRSGLPFELLVASVLLAASLFLVVDDRWAQFGPLGSALGRDHMDLHRMAANFSGFLAVLSVACAIPEWWRYMFGKKLSVTRSLILNVTSIAAFIIIAYVFFSKDAAFGTFVSLALPAGYSWARYHMADFRRFGEAMRRFWRNLQANITVWMAPRPSRRTSS
jgi:hypothetical protein